MPRQTPVPTNVVTDLRGASQLATQAVAGVTDIVEAMHRSISGLAPMVGAAPNGPTTGITGLVYDSVRGVARTVGWGLDLALGQLAPLLGDADTSERRAAVMAALNGVLGDYLLATQNPLAQTMQLRLDGQALALTAPALAANPKARGGKLLVLLHGLCMNDLQWTRDGHNHGTALAADLGYTPIAARYNSGLPVAYNGQLLAGQLQGLINAWPEPVTELTLLGHSMGGLVARSACQQAMDAQQPWLGQLKSMIFLGTPNLGAPLERAGHWADVLMHISPYTAPLTRLGGIRSQGIKDLRHGVQTALPPGVACYAVAASRQGHASRDGQYQRGDGLVPVNSALGLHADPAHSLQLPASHQAVCYGIDHFELLSSPQVYQHLRAWLTPA